MGNQTHNGVIGNISKQKPLTDTKNQIHNYKNRAVNYGIELLLEKVGIENTGMV